MYFLGSCTSHVICVQTYTHALLNVLLIVSFKNLYYFTSKNSHARRSYFENVTRLIPLILKPSIHKITCYYYYTIFFFSCLLRSKHKNLNTIIASSHRPFSLEYEKNKYITIFLHTWNRTT